MIELKDDQRFENDRRSSKGNQYKFYTDNKWYKADYLGYEGLAEYVVSKLLRFSTLNAICAALECQPGDILEYVED